MEKLKDFIEYWRAVARLTEAQIYSWFASVFSKKEDKDE